MFSADGARTVNALVAWFDAELAPGMVLSNGPYEAETHWGQLVMPLDGEALLGDADTLSVRIASIPGRPGQSHLAWSVRAGDGPWEHHDTRERPGDAVARYDHLDTERRAASGDDRQGDANVAHDLSDFLATLAIDANALAKFIADPAAVLEDELSPELQQVMRSCDERVIQAVLFDPSTIDAVLAQVAAQQRAADPALAGGGGETR
jgi:hypothetical protein